MITTTLALRRFTLLLTVGLILLGLGSAGAQPVEDELARVPASPNLAPHIDGCTSVTDLVVEAYVRSGSGVDLDEPTHIGFFQGLEVITDHFNDRILYRPEGSSGPWSESPLALSGPHSVSYSPVTGGYLVDDTENDRILELSDLSSSIAQSASSIAGVDLLQPHDVVFDPASGMSFALNPGAPRVFRLRSLGVEESVLNLTAAANYSRALTVANGRLYVVGSTLGRVIEVLDFGAGTYVVHQSYGFQQEAYAGSWETTGLILNDVERYDGAWYASSFFGPAWAGGTDHNQYKLIRFESWEDFEQGTWEELSPFLPDAVVPYFFTSYGGSLYVASFHSQLAGSDTIFRFTTAMFACGFECGDTECWSNVVPE
jgi:hypothetical protein